MFKIKEKLTQKFSMKKYCSFSADRNDPFWRKQFVMENYCFSAADTRKSQRVLLLFQ